MNDRPPRKGSILLQRSLPSRPSPPKEGSFVVAPVLVVVMVMVVADS